MFRREPVQKPGAPKPSKPSPNPKPLAPTPKPPSPRTLKPNKGDPPSSDQRHGFPAPQRRSGVLREPAWDALAALRGGCVSGFGVWGLGVWGLGPLQGVGFGRAQLRLFRGSGVWDMVLIDPS